MSRTPQSAGSVLRKIVAALILIPLAVVIIAFAVANRQSVTVSLDPFSASAPAASVTLPLFALVIVLLIAGVIVGGAASWLRRTGWRRAARQLEREAGALRREVENLKRPAGGGPPVPEPAEPAERLQLRAPLR